MQWSTGDRNDIDDQRGQSGGGFGGFGAAHLGIGGFLVVLALSWLSGTNLFSLLGTDTTAPVSSVGRTGAVASSTAEERQVDFVDRLQKMTTGHVMPDRFTHGSSAQRVAAFKRGMDSGDPTSCGAPASSTR